MAMVTLGDIAIARSGDKGNSSNVGLMAKSWEVYEFLCGYLTAELVKSHFSEICHGSVTRYELPNLRSLNFILEHSLGGGGAESLLTDAQGKVHGMALLQLKIDIPDGVLRSLRKQDLQEA